MSEKGIEPVVSRFEERMIQAAKEAVAFARGELGYVTQDNIRGNAGLTLIEELRLKDRTYWISGCSKTGKPDDASFKLIAVPKGVNSEDVECYLACKEAEMLAILEGEDAEGIERVVLVAVRRFNEEHPTAVRDVVAWECPPEANAR